MTKHLLKILNFFFNTCVKLSIDVTHNKNQLYQKIKEIKNII